MAQMGLVMKTAQPLVAGRADGARSRRRSGPRWPEPRGRQDRHPSAVSRVLAGLPPLVPPPGLALPFPVRGVPAGGGAGPRTGGRTACRRLLLRRPAAERGPEDVSSLTVDPGGALPEGSVPATTPGR